ncbi:MAG: hypothetical protein WCK42_04020 [Myxococcaceae bacterium]
MSKITPEPRTSKDYRTQHSTHYKAQESPGFHTDELRIPADKELPEGKTPLQAYRERWPNWSSFQDLIGIKFDTYKELSESAIRGSSTAINSEEDEPSDDIISSFHDSLPSEEPSTEQKIAVLRTQLRPHLQEASLAELKSLPFSAPEEIVQQLEALETTKKQPTSLSMPPTKKPTEKALRAFHEDKFNSLSSAKTSERLLLAYKNLKISTLGDSLQNLLFKGYHERKDEINDRPAGQNESLSTLETATSRAALSAAHEKIMADKEIDEEFAETVKSVYDRRFNDLKS